jgi:hypothetical protein
MKIDLKNKLHIFIILTVCVVCFMSLMIVLSPYIREPLGKDADKDGINDEVDNCPHSSNPDQSDVDYDGTGDVCDSCTDTDEDGYGNPGFQANTCPDDNCPTISNVNQTDADQDNIGDVCDNCQNDPQNDVDNDGICGGADNCPSDSNPEQQDSDVDGIGDVCETPPIAMFTFIPFDPIHDETIQFWDNTILGGGVLQTWQWTFGDNTSSIEQHPKHSYTNIGSYIVQLTVTDINGKTSMFTNNITVVPNDPPDTPTITGQSMGITGFEYNYTFKTFDPDSNKIYYAIDWGDNTNRVDLGPYSSGYEINEKHTWITMGNYSITVTAIDTHNAESNDTLFTVRILRNHYILTPSFIQFFEQYHQLLFYQILYM